MTFFHARIGKQKIIAQHTEQIIPNQTLPNLFTLFKL